MEVTGSAQKSNGEPPLPTSHKISDNDKFREVDELEQKRRLRVLKRFVKRSKQQEALPPRQAAAATSADTTNNNGNTTISQNSGPSFTDFLAIDYQEEEARIQEMKKTNGANGSLKNDDNEEDDDDDDEVQVVEPPRQMIIDVDVELGLKPRPLERRQVVPDVPSSHSAAAGSNPLNPKSSALVLSPQEEGYYEGCVSPMTMMEDKQYLNEQQCWIRQQLQLFSATLDDVQNSGSRRSSVVWGKVGVRCRHCAKASRQALGTLESVVKVPQEVSSASNNNNNNNSTTFYWPPGAVSYPFNVNGIHSACSQKTHLHFSHCPYLPPKEKAELKALTDDSGERSSKRIRGGIPAAMYYALAAKRLGVIDVEDGMRFGRDLSLHPLPFETVLAQLEEEKQQQQFALQQQGSFKVGPNGDMIMADNIASSGITGTGTLIRLNGDEASEQVLAEAVAELDNPDKFVARSGDKSLVTDYIFLMIRQMAICHVVPMDFSTRGKKTKSMRLGLAGFCCRHCQYLNTLESSCRSFCSAADNLSSSISGSFSNHLTKCSYVPAKIKKALAAYRRIHQRQMSQLSYGSQRRMFHEMWSRLRAADKTEAEMKEIVAKMKPPPAPPIVPSSVLGVLPKAAFVAPPRSTTGPSAEVIPDGQPSSAPNSKSKSEPKLPYPVSNHPETIAILQKFVESWDSEVKDSLIIPEDKSLVSDYVFLTMRQLKMTVPAPNDTIRIRRGAAVVPTFPGVCCVHCNDQDCNVIPSGRSFPSAPDNFASALNTSLYNHMQACPFIPQDLKNALADLRKLHSSQCSSLKFGSQRRFFNILYERLKNAQGTEQVDASVELTKFSFLQYSYSTAANLFVCRKCSMVPLHFRTPGSVFTEKPSVGRARDHNSQCKGSRLDVRLAVEAFRNAAASLKKEPLELLSADSFKAVMKSALGSENELFSILYEGIRRVFEDGKASSVIERTDLWPKFCVQPNYSEVKTLFSVFASDVGCAETNIDDHPDLLSFLLLLAPGLEA